MLNGITKTRHSTFFLIDSTKKLYSLTLMRTLLIPNRPCLQYVRADGCTRLRRLWPCFGDGHSVKISPMALMLKMLERDKEVGPLYRCRKASGLTSS